VSHVFSGTSLDDMRNNADGIDTAYRLVFASELRRARPPLWLKRRAARSGSSKSNCGRPTWADVDSDQVRANERGPGVVFAEGGFCVGVGEALAVGILLSSEIRRTIDSLCGYREFALLPRCGRVLPNPVALLT